jgi:hypothetical protein
VSIWDAIKTAIADSQNVFHAADQAAGDMARLLAPRIRRVDCDHWQNRDALTKLKRELRDFDMTTGRWKR